MQNQRVILFDGLSISLFVVLSLKMESLSRIDCSHGILCSAAAYAHEVAAFATSPLANE